MKLKLLHIKVCCFIAFNIIYMFRYFLYQPFLSDSYILLAFLQVRKTTPLWFGSGSMRASPSVALPVAPTINWCPMSYPISWLLFLTWITQLCVSFKYSFYSFRARWQTSDNISNLQKVHSDHSGSVYLLKLSYELWTQFDFFCYSTWATCWSH